MGDRKRGLEDNWMEEDDLLGQESKELDLRAKIQRNFSNKHGAFADRSGFREEGNRVGGRAGRFNEGYQRRGENRGSFQRDNNFGGRVMMGHGDHGQSGRVSQQAGEFNKMRRGEGEKGHGGPPRRLRVTTKGGYQR